MRLECYLERIGYKGSANPDLECLKKIHLHHALSVPYENLDTQLGRPVDQDNERIFEKIVTKRRGGWCYEQNGLFGWALSQIGFEVTRVAAAVMRAERGEDSAANHLALLVRTADTDDTWLADVGFGGSGPLLPVALTGEPQDQLGWSYRTVREGDEYVLQWRRPGGWTALRRRPAGSSSATCWMQSVSRSAVRRVSAPVPIMSGRKTASGRYSSGSICWPCARHR